MDYRLWTIDSQLILSQTIIKHYKNMDTRSFLYSILFAATSLACLTDCSSKRNEKDVANEDRSASVPEDTTRQDKPQFEVATTFQRQLSGVFASYLALKEGFFSADAGKIKAAAVRTGEALQRTDMALLSGAAHHDWMTHLPAMANALKGIQSEQDIEAQRKAFSALSDNLYKSIKAFGLGGEEAFYEYCPMAFNNEGAYWLSDEQKIRNPYFGEKMPGCGEVRDTVR
jgi:Cu(I)/Ag(I) efflux system membrane fusion protein